MIRCPFNNFSKCDGSCPFSMPDFTSCRLATALVAIEGSVKGIHAQTVTTNAHLTDMRTKLDELPPVNGAQDNLDEGRKRSQRARYPEKCYLLFSNRVNRSRGAQPDVALSITPDVSDRIMSEIGETVDYMFNDTSGTLILMKGTARSMSVRGSLKERPRMQISIQSEGTRLRAKFGDCTHVYYDADFHDGMVIFKPTGEVD